MNTDDLNFAYKVRHALNEKLDDLPSSTTDRLAAARKAAMARKKADAPARAHVQGTVFAGVASQFLLAPRAWLGRMSVVIPLLLLVAGATGLYHFEQEQRIAELAELDAAVLSDELPLSAYMDHGFNTYLTQSAQ